MALDSTNRRIIYEVLSTNIGYANLQTVLYRLSHTYKDGLTEKEQEFIRRRYETIQEEMYLMDKLRSRLMGTLNGRK